MNRLGHTTLAGFWASIAALAVGGACQRGEPGYYGTVRPLHPPDEVWINNSSEPEWIDPGKCSDNPGSQIIFNLFEGLTDPHPATLDPQPGQAIGWEISPDRRTYVFHLRPGIVWSDGVPVTANDFEYAWKRVLDPKTQAKYASSLYVIANAAAFNQRAYHVVPREGPVTAEEVRAAVERVVPVASATPAIDLPGVFVVVGFDPSFEGATEDEQASSVAANRARFESALGAFTVGGKAAAVTPADASVVAVRALDDRRLRVTIENPVPFFLHLAAFYTMNPVPRHLLERMKAAGENVDLWTRPENIVTNGAFRLREWKFRQYGLFEKNPRYWGADRVRVERVRVVMIESYNTTMNVYKTGDIDWIGSGANVPSEYIDRLRGLKDFHVDPYTTMYFYWANTQAKPLDDLRVRRALWLAIDRDAIVTHVTRAGQKAWASLVPDGLAGYQGLNLPVFDPERARASLAAAGYPGGKGLPAITLKYNTAEVHKQIAEAVQAMWKQHLGIDVVIENLEWQVYLRDLQIGNFQLGRLGWIADYPDPFNFLEILSPHSGNNHSFWKSAEYQRLLDAANAQADPAARLATLRRAEQMAMEALPLLPIYVYTRPYMRKPYLKGFWSNYQDRHLWKHFWIDPRWTDGVPGELSEPPPPMRRPEPVGESAP